MAAESGGARSRQVLAPAHPRRGRRTVRRTVRPYGPAVSTGLTVADTYVTELSAVSSDTTRLRRLAESTGGEFSTLDPVSRLPQRIAALTDARMRFVEHPLWHSPLLFAFVVACFVAEWAMRKRLGLA